MQPSTQRYQNSGNESKSPRSLPSGFTLIEIMLVVGIMAIVLAMGVPPMVRVLKKEPLRQGASDLMEALGHARAQAILRGIAVDLVIGIDTNVYFLVSRPDKPDRPKPESEARLEPPADSKDSAVRPVFFKHLDERVRMHPPEVNFSRFQAENREDVRVRFFPNGTSDDFTVVLEDGTGMRKIRLDPVTALGELEVIR
jgi:prepilin-type N-terminal cleavage/methylation domain-containing protein